MKDLKNRLIYMWIQNIKIEKESMTVETDNKRTSKPLPLPFENKRLHR